MRTPEEWVASWGHRIDREYFQAMVRAIQSDAARSERERCAALMDRLSHNYADTGEGRWERRAVESCARHIRALEPEVPAGPDVADGKGDQA